MVYSLVDKKAIMTRIQNLKNKKHYVQIFKIIKENNATYSQNINGVFINLINIEEDILKISYKKPEDDDTLHPGTIHRGLARRSFDLGYKISAKYDLSKAEAKLENGLLEIAIPISEKAKPKTLKIK